MRSETVIVIGAGPAGLAAAYELAKRDVRPLVLEKADKVGGISRTEIYKGYRFDIGGHRFHTRSEEVRRLWQEMLGEKLLRVSRLSRILYQGQFFRYPLNLLDTLGKLGAVETSLILLSYLRAKLRRSHEEETFEQWVTNRFGARLYRTFFQPYTEKVWGMPGHAIQADWAAQRIGGLSMTTALRSALSGAKSAKTLIHEFRYPVFGPGMMWQRFEEEVTARGGAVHLNSNVNQLSHEHGRLRSVIVGEGPKAVEICADHFISTMPVTDLIARLSPPAPNDVAHAAAGLRHRAFILVGLIVDRADVFPDNWVYIHTPTVRVGRIQNFKNWSTAMVPDLRRTSLGMEYFCTEGDDLWRMPDDELLELAARELVALGLAETDEAVDGLVVRQPTAYPVYDCRYRANLRIIKHFLATFRNLQSVGRNGMHRYNNQDHSMLTGMLAGRNFLGEEHDVWSVDPDGCR